MLDVGNVLLKKTNLFAVICTYTLIYEFLVLRCTILFAKEYYISTSKCTIYVATNICRIEAQNFDLLSQVHNNFLKMLLVNRQGTQYLSSKLQPIKSPKERKY